MTAYPATLEQESIWLDDQLTGGSSRYLESWVCRFGPTLDRDALAWAFDRVVARHDGLRSGYRFDGEQLTQYVLTPDRIPRLEHRACRPEDLDETLRRLVGAPMDLDSGATRATLLDAGPDTTILVVQLHHLVVDDWAIHLLEREIEEHYRARVERRAAALPASPPQPGPYAVRQRAAPRDPEVLAYWRDELADLPDRIATTVPGDVEPAARTGRGARIAFTVEPATTRAVRRLCGRLRTTPFAVFAAQTALLLHLADGADDVIVGTTMSRRGAADSDGLIAPLTTWLPLRVRAHPDQTFADLVAAVKAKTHEAIANRDITYAEVAALARRRRRGGRGLCQTVVILDDGSDVPLTLPGVSAQRLFVYSGAAKSDLAFYFTPAGGEYRAMLEYALDRYSTARAEHIVSSTSRLLELTAAEPERPMSSVAAVWR